MKRKNASTLQQLRAQARRDAQKHPRAKTPQQPSRKPEVTVRFEKKLPAISHRAFDRDIHSAISEIRRTTKHALANAVSILVTDDSQMRKLHRKYKGENTTTDVLTFCASEDDRSGAEQFPIDIVICADEAARRSRELGHSIYRELLLYVVHGLLHCVGYDDHTTKQSARMHREEDRILEAIGIGPTYKK
ncbi:MAG TPA: rRNA maturation RNase YbeY [Phycisphaerales bacterium]|nr:rRNA maturation RNase YbeY [Phycisphaerales bacterium]